MPQEKIQKYIQDKTSEIKQSFQDEDWLKTAELIKKFDFEGFSVVHDWELLNIQCRLAERNLL